MKVGHDLFPRIWEQVRYIGRKYTLPQLYARHHTSMNYMRSMFKATLPVSGLGRMIEPPDKPGNLHWRETNKNMKLHRRHIQVSIRNLQHIIKLMASNYTMITGALENYIFLQESWKINTDDQIFKMNDSKTKFTVYHGDSQFEQAQYYMLAATTTLANLQNDMFNHCNTLGYIWQGHLGEDDKID